MENLHFIMPCIKIWSELFAMVHKDTKDNIQNQKITLKQIHACNSLGRVYLNSRSKWVKKECVWIKTSVQTKIYVWEIVYAEISMGT